MFSISNGSTNHVSQFVPVSDTPKTQVLANHWISTDHSWVSLSHPLSFSNQPIGGQSAASAALQQRRCPSVSSSRRKPRHLSDTFSASRLQDLPSGSQPCISGWCGSSRSVRKMTSGRDDRAAGGVGGGLVEGWGCGRVITKSKRWEICSEMKRRRGGSDECTDVSHPAKDGKDSGSSGLPSPRKKKTPPRP